MPKVSDAPAKKKLREGTYYFKLTNKITPAAEGLPPYQRKKCLRSTNIVWDEERSIPRAVRYVDGVDTIFVDEQRERKIDEKWADANAWVPQFNEGVLFLDMPQDALKIEMLLMLDEYAGKLTRRSPGAVILFDLENKEQASVSDLAFELEWKKAVDRSHKAIDDIEGIKAHALYLGISFKDGPRDKSDDEIKVEYLRKAKSDPALFNKHYDSPLVKYNFLVKQAVTQGIIDLNSVRGKAVWADTKAEITEVDLTKDPVEYLVDYATSPGGSKFIAKLKELLGK